MVDRDVVDKETLDAFAGTIRNEFGIDLTWSERVALKHYMESFGSWADLGQHPIAPYHEALQ